MVAVSKACRFFAVLGTVVFLSGCATHSAVAPHAPVVAAPVEQAPEAIVSQQQVAAVHPAPTIVYVPRPYYRPYFYDPYPFRGGPFFGASFFNDWPHRSIRYRHNRRDKWKKKRRRSDHRRTHRGKTLTKEERRERREARAERRASDGDVPVRRRRGEGKKSAAPE